MEYGIYINLPFIKGNTAFGHWSDLGQDIQSYAIIKHNYENEIFHTSNQFQIMEASIIFFLTFSEWIYVVTLNTYIAYIFIKYKKNNL